MIANLTRGAKSASIHLPAERRQIAGVLSYLGIDYFDEYALPSIGQNASGILVSLEPTEDAEQCIVQICQNETVSLGRLNAGFHQLLSLPYEQQLAVMDRIANERPEHFEDFQNILGEAVVPSVRQKFYCPLTVNLYTPNPWGYCDDDPEEYDGRFAARYADKICRAFRAYNTDDGETMAQYYSRNNTLATKLRSADWGFAVRDGELYGCITVDTAGALTPEQEQDLKDWICGQNSDGIGEGFEQQEIEIDDSRHAGRIYVSLWNPYDDYFIDNESEFAKRLENQSMTLGEM